MSQKSNSEMIREWWYWLVEMYGIVGISLVALLIVLFVWNVCCYVRYSKISKYRNRAKSTNTPISVIVILRDPDEYYLDEVVPKIFSQKYSEFELVVVDVAGDELYTQRLMLIAEHNPKLVLARVAKSKNIRLSDRLAFNIGIKSARYENVILTSVAAEPASNLWLASFAKAFDKGASVVLGYANMELKKGFATRLMRLDIFMGSVRWLSAAIHRHPYCGTIHNLGITQKAYFEAGGFNYLNLQRGIEDLFVQKIANKTNTAVVTSPYGVVNRKVWGGLRWWLNERMADDYPRKYYKHYARRALSGELIIRTLFFGVVVVIALLMPFEILIMAGGLYAIRLFIIMLSLNKIRRRLGERKLIRFIPFYDLISPIYEAAIRMRRSFSHDSKWR